MSRRREKQAWYTRKRLAADPNYQPRTLTRGPSVWDETYLTEPYAEFKARKQAERAAERAQCDARS